MEEESEQLDYDEDVLEAAQKKAKELRQELIVSQQSSIQPSSLPSTTSGTNSIETITTNSAAPRPNFRYYVNPNFNKPRNLHHSNIPNLPITYGHGQINRFRQAGSVYQNPQQQVYLNQPRHLLHSNQMTAAFPAPHPPHAPASNFHHHLGLPTIPTPSIPAASSGGNIYINRNAIATNNNNWDMMVDEFVRKNISARRHRHHYSRSPSSSSSSRSTSANSSTSRSHSASRSPSSSPNGRERKDSSSRWKNSTKKATNKYNKSTSDTRRHGQPTKSKNEQVNITHQTTIECARAIGLDDEYLKKIEEQNRLREEIARRKSQHRRQETTETKIGTTKLLDGGPAQKRPKIQGPNGRAAATKEEKGVVSNNKLRPYLAVVVTNLRGVGQAEKKVSQLAATIGPVKKIWRDGADDCHVIFERHEHAKQFMLQFHGKRDVLPKEEKEKATAAPCIDVTLKKVFLNLTGTGSSIEE